MMWQSWRTVRIQAIRRHRRRSVHRAPKVLQDIDEVNAQASALGVRNYRNMYVLAQRTHLGNMDARGRHDGIQSLRAIKLGRVRSSCSL